MSEKEFDQIAVEELNSYVNLLVDDYKRQGNLEYLKETLREIRCLVHQANLNIDQLIIDKQWEEFDHTYCTNLLTSTFPNLKWEVEKYGYGNNLIVNWLGKIQGLEIEVKCYNTPNNYSVLVDFDYKDESTFSPYCESYYSTIEEVIQEIKDIIIPLQQTLSQIKIN